MIVPRLFFILFQFCLLKFPKFITFIFNLKQLHLILQPYLFQFLSGQSKIIITVIILDFEMFFELRR